MIFLTVGSELPFDRLVKTVDRWAMETGQSNIFAQIGDGGWEPEYLEFSHFLEPAEFARRVDAARIIIAHAGIGTILSALQSAKPILIMPRRASLGELRNEHQLATARRLLEMGKVNVAFDEVALRSKLETLGELTAPGRIATVAGEELQSAIRDFIRGNQT